MTWDPPIVGNMECHQRKATGPRVNHGRFRQWYASGRLALEGAFVDGKRDGTWTFYDESGEPKRERTYALGVERSVPAGPAGERAPAPVLQSSPAYADPTRVPFARPQIPAVRSTAPSGN